MSATEWEDRGEDVEEVDAGELDDVPPGTADEDAEGGLGGGSEEAGRWTEGGGALGPEGEVDAEAEPSRRDDDTF